RLLRCGRVGTHAVERRGPVGIALCSTSTAGFPALHLSATFGHRPLVGPGLESAVLRCARQFILVVVLVTVLHGFREFAVAGCLVAFDIEKLGCGSRLHFYPGDFALDCGTVNLVDGVSMSWLIADVDVVLHCWLIALPLDVRFSLGQGNTRHYTQTAQEQA